MRHLIVKDIEFFFKRAAGGYPVEFTIGTVGTLSYSLITVHGDRLIWQQGRET